MAVSANSSGQPEHLRQHWIPWRVQFSRRGVAIMLTLAIEGLLVLILLTLNAQKSEERVEVPMVTAFDVRDPASQPEAQPEQAQPEQAQASPAQPTPPSPQAAAIPAPPAALPPLAPPTITVPPISQPQPPAEPAPAEPARPRIRAVVREGASIGPPDIGRPGPPDSEVVGTAPDGSPLYAARWYREPYRSELDGYLSTARGPGWGLIVCRTAPNWRVEDCEILGESPRGSGIARSAHAAAWQFLVRPPFVKGEYKVGSWVRIRINLGTGAGPQD